MNSVPRFIGLLALAVLAGCARQPTKPAAQTYPVRGKVVLANGHPLPAGTVTFHAKSKPGNDALALIASDGSFALGTFGKDDGAIPGEYVVTVAPPPAKRVPVRIPKKFQEEGASPWKVTVRAAENQLAPFTLR